MPQEDVRETSRSSNSRGSFIVLEGVDGSGISTQAARLQAFLESYSGRKVLSTKEPSDGPVGFLLRQALNQRLTGLNQEIFALLFAADRLDHLNQRIRPALAQGSHVVCDRYLWSSLAYQGESVHTDWVEQINARALKPDLTLFIRVAPEVTLERIHSNRFQVDLFEHKAFLERVLARFDDLVAQAREQGEPVVVIDGSLPVESVAHVIQDHVSAFLACS